MHEAKNNFRRGEKIIYRICDQASKTFQSRLDLATKDHWIQNKQNSQGATKSNFEEQKLGYV